MAKPKNTLDTLNEVEDSPIRKNLSDMTRDELIERINYLENIDGIVGIFYANNRKLNELAKSLNSFTLDLVDGGKSFSNYLSLQKEYKDMVGTQQWLRQELKLTDGDVKNETKKYLPPIELRLNQNPQ